MIVCTKEKFLKVELAILPSKRARKIPEKIQVAPEDLAELTAKAEPEVEVSPELENVNDEETEVSLDQIVEAETEAEATEVNSDESETTNS